MAQIYDGTVAADYYRAMGQIEQALILPESQQITAFTPAALLALLDSLNSSTLNQYQRTIVRALKEGIMSLAMREIVAI